MIHSRLRRSFRLAVDLLSLNFAGSSSSHPAHLFFRGARANASALLTRPTLPALRLPRLGRFRSPQQNFNIWSRRHLASCGLLLALSLEVCGCDPETVSSLAFDPASHPLREPVRSDQALAFYDPADPAMTLASSSLPNPDAFTDAKPLPAEARALPWAIPESVYFIYKGHHTGSLSPRQPPVATAFVLSVPDHNHERYLRFLVTARHVVDPQWAHCSEQNPASIDLRLNRRNGGVGYETVALRSGAVRRYYTPLDSTADIAVIPLDESLIPGLGDYKFIDVPFRLLLTESEMQTVRADQAVMTARPSSQPSGELNNYPVFDGGVLSKMPSETVGVRCGIAQDPESTTRAQTRLLHVWFITAGIPQGVSGAPVYASIARRSGAGDTPVLLGVQSVAWPDKGIAGITTSPALGDLIRSALARSKLDLDFYRGPNP